MLDTAILITALRSSSGAAAEVVRLTLLGEFTILMDLKLVCEYLDVALRPEQIEASGKTHQEIEEIIEALGSVASPVLVLERHRPLSQDKNDDMVLDVAINGNADVLVTNNTKHFLKAAALFGIQVMTPRQLLTAIRI